MSCSDDLLSSNFVIYTLKEDKKRRLAEAIGIQSDRLLGTANDALVIYFTDIYEIAAPA